MTMVTFKPLSTEKGKAEKGIGMPPAGAEGPAPPPVLHLSHEHLKALKLQPKVGQKLHIHAVAHVAHASEDQDQSSGGKASGAEGNTRRTATLHFHQMEIGGGAQQGMSDEDQTAGAKAEIDKALTKSAGNEKSQAKAPGPKEGGKGS